MPVLKRLTFEGFFTKQGLVRRTAVTHNATGKEYMATAHGAYISGVHAANGIINSV